MLQWNNFRNSNLRSNLINGEVKEAEGEWLKLGLNKSEWMGIYSIESVSGVLWKAVPCRYVFSLTTSI